MEEKSLQVLDKETESKENENVQGADDPKEEQVNLGMSLVHKLRIKNCTVCLTLTEFGISEQWRSRITHVR